MTRHVCFLLSALCALPTLGATVHLWGFEADTLPLDGTFSVYRQGKRPVYSADTCGDRIWDGGTYSLVRDDNRRSVYFGDDASDSLSPVGGEVVFDGTTGRFQYPTLTVECFVRIEEQTNRFALLVSKRRESGSSWSLAVDPSGAVMVRFDTQEGRSGPGFNQTVSSGTSIADGNWHHVAMTFDQDLLEAALYVDYRLCRKTRTQSPLFYDGADVTIGRGLNGWIDEVRISDAALHPEQFLRTTRFISDLRTANLAPRDVMIDLTPTRVQTGVRLDWEKVGTLRPKSVDEIPGDFWSLGCETLDRDLADWDAYKGYLKPLGIKRIRLQGGWAKTEKQKGVYDFEWLDHIVDSAHDLGLTVCLETSYGNRLYEPKAGLGPGGVLPSGDETLAAWDAWVEAMVRHYSPKGVNEWMMYNEPNLNRENTPEDIVAFNARTAAVIKRVDPDAKIAGLVCSGLNLSLIEKWLKGMQDMGKLDLFEWVIYHGYGANPDSLAPGMKRAQALVRHYSPTLKLWQGEAGCASEPVQYALSGIDWTEISHGKWNARRMLCDVAHGIESTVFTISDLSYHKDFISRYGLLKTAPDNSIIKVKSAYYVVNNVVSLFSDSVVAIAEANVDVSPGDGVVRYRFRHRESGYDLIALWDSTAIPVHRCRLETVDLSVVDLNLEDPVWIDVLTGRIYRVPGNNVIKVDNVTSLVRIPILDSPVVLTDRSILSYVEARKTKERRTASPTPIPRRAAADGTTMSLQSYRLFGAQKPAPAVIICRREDNTAEWAVRLAETLRGQDIHAFIHTGQTEGIANAVRHIRAQATPWQVDPEQIGVLGRDNELTRYQALGANFAVIPRRGTDQPLAPDAAHVRVLDVDQTEDIFGEDSRELKSLLDWLDSRKKAVF